MRYFDATLDILCAQVQSEAIGGCNAKIAHGDNNDAAKVVTFNNEFSRTLIFFDGTFVRANATMSGLRNDIDFLLFGYQVVAIILQISGDS